MGVRNQVFLEGDKLEVAVICGRWVFTYLPAGPKPGPGPAEHYFPTNSDDVTLGVATQRLRRNGGV